MKKYILLLLIAAYILPASAQRIESGYIMSSDFKDCDGKKIGKGAVQYLKGSYSIPLSVERVEQIKNTQSSTMAPNGEEQIITKSDTAVTARMWQLTLTGKYATFDDEGAAMQHRPDDIIDAGVMITHVCPIAHRWNLIATAGATLNATSTYIRRQSVSITAGIIFQYTVNRNLHLGLGAVGTTSYGEPVVIPVPMINWKRDGLYSVELNMHGMPELTIATQLTPNTRLRFSPFEMERFSAMIDYDGEHMVFSQNVMKSSIGVSYRIDKHWSLEGAAGYVYRHTVRIQERSFKAFWDDLFSNNNRMKYSNNCTFTVGLRYHIR